MEKKQAEIDAYCSALSTAWLNFTNKNLGNRGIKIIDGIDPLIFEKGQKYEQELFIKLTHHVVNGSLVRLNLNSVRVVSTDRFQLLALERREGKSLVLSGTLFWHAESQCFKAAAALSLLFASISLQDLYMVLPLLASQQREELWQIVNQNLKPQRREKVPLVLDGGN